MGKYKRDVEIFKALGDENRMLILEMLRKGERCACELLEEMGIGQPTLSHHMKILCSTGLVQSRKQGRWVYYSIDPEGRLHWLQRFVELTDMEPDSILRPYHERQAAQAEEEV